MSRNTNTAALSAMNIQLSDHREGQASTFCRATHMVVMQIAEPSHECIAWSVRFQAEADHGRATAGKVFQASMGLDGHDTTGQVGRDGR